MPAPKGNKNAFKHGLYSKFIAASNDDPLTDMELRNNKKELAFARVCRAAAQKAFAAAVDDKMRLRWDQSCRHWTEIIGRLMVQNTQHPKSEPAIHTTHLEDELSAILEELADSMSKPAEVIPPCSNPLKDKERKIQ